MDNLKARTKTVLSENERRNAMHAKNLEMAVERVAEVRYRVKNILPAEQRRIEATINDLFQSKEMKRLENNLRRKGLTFRDPRYWRILSTAVDKLFDGWSRDRLAKHLEEVMKGTLDEMKSGKQDNIWNKMFNN